MTKSLAITALCMTCIFSCVVKGDSPCRYPQICGNLTINYPFQIQGSNCGVSNFSLVCKENSTFGEGRMPFIPTPTGEYQVLNLTFNSLVINVTHLKASSCSSSSEPAKAFFSLPRPGPFTISGTNVFASVGCYANGSFFSTTLQSNNQSVGGMCAASCFKIFEPGYCNGFGCCQTTFMENWRRVNLEAKPYAQPPPGECVFSTILDPTTFKVQSSDKGRLGAGTYGLKIDWGIEGDVCSTGNLTCSKNAACLNVTGMPGFMVCKCDEGYAGDGYQGGLQCTDIDECSDPKLHDCIPPAGGKMSESGGFFQLLLCKGKRGWSKELHREGHHTRSPAY
ncbi:hypothetical protein KI387_038082, partial [Taxus chinensis]